MMPYFTYENNFVDRMVQGQAGSLSYLSATMGGIAKNIAILAVVAELWQVNLRLSDGQ